eukprot:CAMPEP_0171057008 /NCGR_PEP_ID=MMETSP0766_2-20121228/1508_1 /TAXON_ID=439317 /ORGANISM="Gambierdiscus australes, Strain CAWD 149" /LENGTH=233 /DNA_ID=CAMNT_0011512049 /DNA_START=251 /DNA_END=952 /DNA_ORIENTATION=+
MANFGAPKDKVTERHAAWVFVWIITMCVAHMFSALLMAPVVAFGWLGLGATGQTLFILGTLSEVGFDIHDWLRLFMLVFFPASMGFPGEPLPLKIFILLGVCHHSTVLSLVVPMNMKYAHLPAYHHIAFSLLLSAGVCFLAGHYKLTLDITTPRGLRVGKAVVALQFVANYVSRLFIFFPAAYSVLATFRRNEDLSYFYGGLVGVIGLGLYNIVVAVDATSAASKWLVKTGKL